MMGQFSGKGWQIAIGFLALCAGTVAADWQGAQRLDLDGLGNAADARIEVADGGFVAAAWRQNGDVCARLWEGHSWSPAQNVSEGSPPATTLALAVNNSGTVVVAWEAGDGFVYANRRDGQTWVGASAINTEDQLIGFGEAPPEVAVSESGAAIIVATLVIDSEVRATASHWIADQWSVPQVIDTQHPIEFSSNVQVAVDDAGQAIAVWQQSDGNLVTVRANYWDGQAWIGPEQIDADADKAGTTPDIDLDSEGNAVAIWRLSDGSTRRIETADFDGSDWSGSVAIDPGSQRLTGPRVGLAGNGKAVATWRLDASGNRRVYGNTRHDGAWGEALLLDDGGDTNISNAELAVDRAGRAFVVWNQSDGTRTRTVARRWDGSTWLPLELLDNGLNPTFSAQIALAGDGSGAAAWLESVNGELQVFVARFDFDPIFADRFEAASDAGPADAGAEKPSAL